jgi:hypothetical protein
MNFTAGAAGSVRRVSVRALDPAAQLYWGSAHRSEYDRLLELRARGGRVAVFTASPDVADHPPPGG